MKIKRRIHISIMVSAALAAVVVLALGYFYFELNKISRDYDASRRFLKGVIELRFFSFEYAMHHEERMKEQWLAKHEALDRLIREIGMQNNNRLKDREIITGIQKTHDSVKEIFLQITSLQAKIIADGEQGFVSRELCKRWVSQLLVKTTDMVSNSFILDGISHRKGIDIITYLYIVIFISLGTLIASIIINFRIIASRIAYPIINLQKDIAVIGSGDLDHRINIAADDEIGQLSISLENMAKNLKSVTASRDDLNREIIERNKIEDELQNLNRDLETRVNDRTSSLSDANRELEAFTYSVSHDLRAPLRAIDGYVRILMEEYSPRLDPEGARICSVISEGARNMGKLIDDLLAFSRIGRAEIQAHPIDMTSLVQSIYSEITTLEDRCRTDFHLNPLPEGKGNPTLLRHVWMNLLGNAVKFSSKKERAQIEIGAEESVDEIIYWIRDNGAGFDMSYLDRLFNVFQRLHSVKEFPGTGIGLAIVKRIVLMHGGRVWAEGEPDRGAGFYFTMKKEDGHEIRGND